MAHAAPRHYGYPGHYAGPATEVHDQNAAAASAMHGAAAGVPAMKYSRDNPPLAGVMPAEIVPMRDALAMALQGSFEEQKSRMDRLNKRLEVLQHAYVNERSARMAYQRRNAETVTVEAPLVTQVDNVKLVGPKTPPDAPLHAPPPTPVPSAHNAMALPATPLQPGWRGDVQLVTQRLRHRFREWVVGQPLPAPGQATRPPRPVPSTATMAQRREGTAAAAAAALLGAVTPENTAAAIPAMLPQDPASHPPPKQTPVPGTQQAARMGR